MVASGKRNIRNGSEYNKYFDLAELQGKVVTLKPSGDTFDTIVLMKDLILKHKHQTAKIAKELKGSNREETCRNIWNWIYNHFQYTQDSATAEELRTPLRSWKDRTAGIDCDCMSILAGTILSCLNIPFALRKTKYSGKAQFQHIYVVVPKSGSSLNNGYYTIDAVVDQFNYEVPFSGKHDLLMMPINMLNGLELGSIGLHGLAGLVESNRHSKCFCNEFNGLGQLPGVDYTPEIVHDEMLIRIKMHLKNTLQELDRNPSALKNIGLDPAAFRKRLTLVLQNWDNAPMRDKILAELEAEEDRASLNGVGLEGFFKRIGSAIKKTTKKATTFVRKTAVKASVAVNKGVKAAGKGISNAAKWTADKAKDAVKFIIRFNPLTIAIRNGLLLAFKINLFRMSERLGYALWTEGEAQVKGLDMNEYRKLKGRYDKIVKVFTKLQGKKENLDKALKDGWDKGTQKHGLLRGLGEPATAATTTAASGVIATIVNWLKDVDFKALLKKVANKPDYAGEDQAAANAPGDGNQLPLELAQEIIAAGGKVFQPKAAPGQQPVQYTLPANYQEEGYQGQAPAPAAGNNTGLIVALGAAAIGAAILLRK